MAMAGARAAVAQGRLAGHDHRPPLLGLDVLDVQLWIEEHLGVVACGPVVASAWRAALEDVMLHLHPPRLLLRFLPQGVFDPHR